MNHKLRKTAVSLSEAVEDTMSDLRFRERPRRSCHGLSMLKRRCQDAVPRFETRRLQPCKTARLV